MHLGPFTRLVLLIAAFSAASEAVAYGYDFEIGYHEYIEIVSQPDSERLSFVAFGRQFDVELERNTAIAGASEVDLYRGQLTGTPGSWVRLARYGGGYSGGIWDGNELWLIDSHERLQEFLAQPDDSSAGTRVIFPLSELSGEYSDIVLDGFQEIREGPIPEIAAASFGPQPGRVLDIGLVATADFTARYGASARDELLAMFNLIEGIYITQVGVQLRAAEVQLFDSDPTELQTDDAEELLDNFGTWKISQPAFRSLGIAHLFASRNFVEADGAGSDTQTVGLAYLSSVCSQRFGVGITQATHTSLFDALIAAHEIGHNFGAPHDAETGSVCASEPDSFIMAPRLNGNPYFSQCSIDQMLPEIVAATCMPAIAPTDLQLTVINPPPSSIDEGERINFEVALANLSASDAVGLELILSSDGFSSLTFDTAEIGDSNNVSRGQCIQGDDFRCVFPFFDALTSVDFEVRATASTAGEQTISMTADSLNELDASDNELAFNVEIIPPADLGAFLSPQSAIMRPGESLQLEGSIINHSLNSANDVVAFLRFGSAGVFRLTQIDLVGCPATDAASSIFTLECPIGEMVLLEERRFTLTIELPPDADLGSPQMGSVAHVSLFVSSRELPVNNEDRLAETTITVGEAVADLDLRVQGPATITVGQSVDWVFTLTNNGPDSVDSVRLYSDDAARTLPSSASSISTTLGSCALTTTNAEFECTFDTFDPGQTATVTLTVTPETTGTLFVIEAFTESTVHPDNDVTNNGVFISVSVDDAPAPPPPGNNSNPGSSQSGGGGGSTGMLSLILLALLTWRQRGRKLSAQGRESANN